MSLFQIFGSIGLISLLAWGLFYLVEGLEQYIASDEMED